MICIYGHSRICSVLKRHLPALHRFMLSKNFKRINLEKPLERENTERVQRSTVFPTHSHDWSWSKSSSHTSAICAFLRMGFFFSFNFWTRKSFTSFNLRSVSGLITPLDTKYRRTWEVWALKNSLRNDPLHCLCELSNSITLQPLPLIKLPVNILPSAKNCSAMKIT